MLMLVVFPAPFGPKNAHTSPEFTANETCVSAGTSCPPHPRRYTFVTPSNSIAAVIARLSRARRNSVFHLEPKLDPELDLHRFVQARLRPFYLAVFVHDERRWNCVHRIRIGRLMSQIKQHGEGKFRLLRVLFRRFAILVDADRYKLKIRIVFVILL